MSHYLVLLISLALSIGVQATDYNVLTYGARGDGETNDVQAFSAAWNDACSAAVTDNDIPTVVVPAGKKSFLVSPVAFKGPCKSPSIHFQIDGNIVAPSDRSGWTNCLYNCWIVFSEIDNLVVQGSGIIDGKGSTWWTNSLDTNYDNFTDDSSCNNPRAIQFLKCNGLQLNGLTHTDSPRAHIGISDCNNSTISNLHISAPADSPNTDGIDISGSINVQIRDSVIGTGDDCIAINSGVSYINIIGVTCGPGHGISIGSLGSGGEDAQVEEVHVKNCTFNGTTNGARIKTWQGGAGYARKITFEDIPLINVRNPIIIDQFYCNGKTGCGIQPSAVEISDVTYRGFSGSSATEPAINLNCSDTKPCTNIVMESISIDSSDPSQKLYASCHNAMGKETSVSPQVPCLATLA